MIEFLTLFLGIVVGPQTVSLMADNRVAAIEVQLDGRAVGRIAGPPWELKIDLGPELAPHVLTAIASDSEGHESGRAVQLLNVPRPAAEAHFLLDRDPSGIITAARMSWESSAGRDPQEVTVSLDGRPLALEDNQYIDLQGIDSSQFHFLQADLMFSDQVRATTQIAFGGEYLDSASAELTSLTVIPRGKRKQPKPEEMASWFLKNGEPLSAVAVEKGLAEIVVVRGPGVANALADLPGLPSRDRPDRGQLPTGGIGGLAASPPKTSGVSSSSPDLLRQILPLADDQRLQLLEPYARRHSGRQLEMDTFAISPQVSPTMGGIYWALGLQVSLPGLSPQPRVTDALAVAALHAASGNRRRAVLLVLAEPWEETSRHDLADVRGFTRCLNVPLVIWVIGDQRIPAAERGDAQRITSYRELRRAKNRLSEKLNLQRIVWLEGRHEPTSIQVSERAGVMLASGPPSDPGP
jgi:hypothetical protein